jgi:hypothetical protein
MYSVPTFVFIFEGATFSLDIVTFSWELVIGTLSIEIGS